MPASKRLAGVLILGLTTFSLAALSDPGPGADTPEAGRWNTLVPQPSQRDRQPGVWLSPGDWRVDFGPADPDEAASLADRLDRMLTPLGRRWHRVVQGPADLRLTAAGAGDEAYSLTVAATGVVVEASTAAGRYYGLVTLTQLLPTRADRTEAVRVAAGTVTDAPRWTWRGLMIDSARHFVPIDDLETVLEWMALHKLNRFHWHLTDDQGWRLEIPSWPKLTEVGGVREEVDGRTTRGWYTAADVARIVAFAAHRHIVVVPEIDLPGHSSAALAAYPELSALGLPRQVPIDWAIADGVLSVGRATVDRFTTDLLAELIRLFPGPYVHWGGDEVFRHPYLKNAESLAWMARQRVTGGDEAAAAFWNDLARQTLAAGKTPLGWNGATLASPPRGTVVQWWDDPTPGQPLVPADRPVILSWKQALYLDYPEVDGDGDRAWWMPVTDLAQLAKLPLRVPGVPDAPVWGIEATLFAERSSAEKLGRKLFPRLALVADLAWTGDRPGPGWEARITAHRDRLAAWGVGMPPAPQ